MSWKFIKYEAKMVNKQITVKIEQNLVVLCPQVSGVEETKKRLSYG